MLSSLRESLRPLKISSETPLDDRLSVRHEDGSKRENGNQSSLLAGSLMQIVERITNEKFPDNDLLKGFLLTYRTYTSPSDLLDLLKERYYTNPPSELSSKDTEKWKKKQLMLIRLRVVNVLKTWITSYFYDFEEDKALLDKMIEFVDTNSDTTVLKKAGPQIKKLISRQQGAHKADSQNPVFSKQPPKPLLPMNLQSTDLAAIDFPAEELARQLTLIDHGLLKAIKPWEFLDVAWEKEDKDQKAPNIVAMMKHHARISQWVATSIILPFALKDRGNVLKHMIDIAHKCLGLQSYGATIAICMGIQSPSVAKLKQTWATLTGKSLKVWAELEQISCSAESYKNLREKLDTVSTPCIPYLGLFLGQLASIAGHLKDFVGEGAINIEKCRQIATVIESLSQYQTTPYCLIPVQFIQEYLSVESQVLSEEDCSRAASKREDANKIQPAPAGKGKGFFKNFPSLDRKDSGLQQHQKPEVSGVEAEELSPEEMFGVLEAPPPGYPFGDEIPDTAQFQEIKNYNRLVGATLERLIKHVTSEKGNFDTALVNTFLFTFPIYTTANKVLELLSLRFNMPKPVPSATKQQQDAFRASKLVPVHFKIINFAKTWVDKFPDMFQEDQELKEELSGFIKEILEYPHGKAAERVLELLEKKQVKTPSREDPLADFGSNSSSTFSSVSLLDVEPEKLATMLNLTCQIDFMAIRSREFLQATYFKDMASCTSLGRLLRKVEITKRWAVTCLLLEDDCRKQAAVLTHLVQVAEHLLAMRNFVLLASVVEAISQVEDTLIFAIDWIEQSTLASLEKLRAAVASQDKTGIAEDVKDKACVPNIYSVLRALEAITKEPNYRENSTTILNIEKHQQFYTCYNDYIHVFQKLCFDVGALVDEKAKAYLSNSLVWDDDVVAEKTASFVPSPFLADKVTLLQSRADQLQDMLHSLLIDDVFYQQLLEGASGDESVAVLEGDMEALEAQVTNFVQGVEKEVEVLKEGCKKEAREGEQEEEEEEEEEGGGLLDPQLELHNDLISHRYPDSEVSLWTHHDEAGHVFGFPADVHLHLITPSKSICSPLVAAVEPFADLPQIHSLVRSATLFKESPSAPFSNFEMVLVAPVITHEAREAAEALEVVLG